MGAETNKLGTLRDRKMIAQTACLPSPSVFATDHFASSPTSASVTWSPDYKK
jgi:hypothetical protein